MTLQAFLESHPITLPVKLADLAREYKRLGGVLTRAQLIAMLAARGYVISQRPVLTVSPADHKPAREPLTDEALDRLTGWRGPVQELAERFSIPASELVAYLRGRPGVEFRTLGGRRCVHLRREIGAHLRP